MQLRWEDFEVADDDDFECDCLDIFDEPLGNPICRKFEDNDEGACLVCGHDEHCHLPPE